MSRKRKPKTFDYQELRRKCPRAGEPWTREEDAWLRNQRHRPNHELAEIAQRTLGAIRSRRKKLGICPLMTGQLKQPPVAGNAAQPKSKNHRAARQPARETRPVQYATALTTPWHKKLYRFVAIAIIAFALVAIVVWGITATRPEHKRAERHGVRPIPTNGAIPDPTIVPSRLPLVPLNTEEQLTFVTWNMRGYPENVQSDTDWVHYQLSRIGVDVLCAQEMANLHRVQRFCAIDKRLGQFAFENTQSRTDNAILCADRVVLTDLPDPVGFQHTPQVALACCGGFDAVVVSLHLSSENWQWREKEMRQLGKLVADMRKIDPDIILAGDFNLGDPEIRILAEKTGMKVTIPSHREWQGTVHAGSRWDYFLISSDLADEEFLSVHIEKFTDNDLTIAKRVSDHVPVVARFRIDDRFRDRSLGT